MDFGELLLKLKRRTLEVLVFLWNQDYTPLEKKVLGVSLLDIVAVLFACYVLWQIIRFLISLVGSILNISGKVALSYLVNVVLLIVRTILLRAWYTLDYLWHTERLQHIRLQVEEKTSRIFTRFLNHS